MLGLLRLRIAGEYPSAALAIIILFVIGIAIQGGWLWSEKQKAQKSPIGIFQ
jgi:hypothetical protein